MNVHLQETFPTLFTTNLILILLKEPRNMGKHYQKLIKNSFISHLLNVCHHDNT